MHFALKKMDGSSFILLVIGCLKARINLPDSSSLESNLGDKFHDSHGSNMKDKILNRLFYEYSS